MNLFLEFAEFFILKKHERAPYKKFFFLFVLKFRGSPASDISIRRFPDDPKTPILGFSWSLGNLETIFGLNSQTSKKVLNPGFAFKHSSNHIYIYNILHSTSTMPPCYNLILYSKVCYVSIICIYIINTIYHNKYIPQVIHTNNYCFFFSMLCHLP